MQTGTKLAFQALWFPWHSILRMWGENECFTLLVSGSGSIITETPATNRITEAWPPHTWAACADLAAGRNLAIGLSFMPRATC